MPASSRPGRCDTGRVGPSPIPVKAVTVHQPWAGLIALGAKDVENRSWRPPSVLYGQRIAIHAGRHVDPFAPIPEHLVGHPLLEILGAVLATVCLADVVRGHPSAWSVPGAWQWVLTDPILCDPPRPARGMPGIWTLTRGDPE